MLADWAGEALKGLTLASDYARLILMMYRSPVYALRPRKNRRSGK